MGLSCCKDDDKGLELSCCEGYDNGGWGGGVATVKLMIIGGA